LIYCSAAVSGTGCAASQAESVGRIAVLNQPALYPRFQSTNRFHWSNPGRIPVPISRALSILIRNLTIFTHQLFFH
jgi:hypothetical protein